MEPTNILKKISDGVKALHPKKNIAIHIGPTHWDILINYHFDLIDIETSYQKMMEERILGYLFGHPLIVNKEREEIDVL